MSYEQKTKLKPDLPRGDYTIVARLTDYAGSPYTAAHADFLSDVLSVSAKSVEVDDGHLFVALAVRDKEGLSVTEQAACPLYLGLARLALDPEILAFAIPSSQLNPERPLAGSFPYLSEDVTLELRHELDELALQPPIDNDLSLEIEHLSDF